MVDVSTGSLVSDSDRGQVYIASPMPTPSPLLKAMLVLLHGVLCDVPEE